MHDLRDYKTLTPKQITTAISQLNHNTAPKIMTHLALRARQPHPFGNQRSRTKALKLLRRVKKAHKAGRIPFELTVTGSASIVAAIRLTVTTTTGRCWPRAGNNMIPRKTPGISASGFTPRSSRPLPMPKGIPVM